MKNCQKINNIGSCRHFDAEKDTRRAWSLAVICAAMFSMLAGGLIYLFWRPVPILLFQWLELAGLGAPLELARQYTVPTRFLIPGWALFSLPNGLWAFAYALIVTHLWWARRSVARYAWLASIPALGLGWELLQYAGMIPGTFCLHDLAFCVAGIGLGFLIGLPVHAKRQMIASERGTRFATSVALVLCMSLAVGSTVGGPIILIDHMRENGGLTPRWPEQGGYDYRAESEVIAEGVYATTTYKGRYTDWRDYYCSIENWPVGGSPTNYVEEIESVKIGARNDKGEWEGHVVKRYREDREVSPGERYSWSEIRGNYRNGQRHGIFEMYDTEGNRIASMLYHNGKFFPGAIYWDDDPPGLYAGAEQGKVPDLREMEYKTILRGAMPSGPALRSKSGEDAYSALYYKHADFLLEMLLFDSACLVAYLNFLNSEIVSVSAEDEVSFAEAYQDAVEKAFTAFDFIYYDIVAYHSWLIDKMALSARSHGEFRLAIFDKYLDDRESIYAVLADDYPEYLDRWMAYGVSELEIEAFLYDLQREIEESGPMTTDDPLYFEEWDARISWALINMETEDHSSALFAMFLMETTVNWKEHDPVFQVLRAMHGFGASGPVSGDYDGDGKSDFAVFCGNSGLWYVLANDQETPLVWGLDWGWPGAIPVPGDYIGDGKSDFAVFCGNSGLWYVLANDQETSLVWGLHWGWPGAIPVPGDFDGDGKSDFAVFCGNTGNWYVFGNDRVTTIAWELGWGWPGAIPVPGDYTGDGKSDFAVFCGNTGNWYVLANDQATPVAWELGWGWPGAVPVPGDYTGDGKSDFAVFCGNTGNWYVLANDQATPVAWELGWGWPGAIPVPGDYNGDGKSDFAVFCGNTGNWYVLESNQNNARVWGLGWGWPGAVPPGALNMPSAVTPPPAVRYVYYQEFGEAVVEALKAGGVSAAVNTVNALAAVGDIYVNRHGVQKQIAKIDAFCYTSNTWVIGDGRESADYSSIVFKKVASSDPWFAVFFGH